MSEIAEFFGDLKKVPDFQACVTGKVFSNKQPTIGYVLSTPDSPACQVKLFLLEVLHYCNVAFEMDYDIDDLKKCIFEHTDQ